MKERTLIICPSSDDVSKKTMRSKRFYGHRLDGDNGRTDIFTDVLNVYGDGNRRWFYDSRFYPRRSNYEHPTPTTYT